MADKTTYVVMGTQLNRRVKGEDGDWETANIPRGTEFAEGDQFSDEDPGVSAREIKRWLSLEPRMIASKADLEKAQQSANEAAAALDAANAKIAELTAQLAAATAAGASTPDATGGPGTDVDPPARNASAEDWRAYVKATHPDLDTAEVDATSRDDLRDLYGPKQQ
jgi:hypothetical protein